MAGGGSRQANEESLHSAATRAPQAVKAGRASFMPIGLFKTADQSVQVDYDGISIPIPRSTYENRGYKPDFDKLPLEDEYRAAQDNTPRP